MLVLSIVRRADTTYVYAFVLGLLSDLLSQTPVGLTPLLLLIASFALSRAFEVMDKTSYSMPLIACLVSVLLYELLIAIVLLLLGYQAGFFVCFCIEFFQGRFTTLFSGALSSLFVAASFPLATIPPMFGLYLEAIVFGRSFLCCWRLS